MRLIGSTRLWGLGCSSPFMRRLCLNELDKRGLKAGRQQAVPAAYEGIHIHTAFYADLIVEDKVIVEIKAVEDIAPVHKMQLLNLSEAGRQTSGAAHQLQCRLIKDGITDSQQTPRIIRIKISCLRSLRLSLRLGEKS
jgi:GxxExxY protein